MKKMKSVMLVFDDQKELEFINMNLSESGFQIYIAENLKNAVKAAEKFIPDLIVINTLDNEFDLNLFSEQVQTERLKNVSVLSLIAMEDYFTTSNKRYFIVKPVRPKLLLSLIRGVMNGEEVNWMPSLR
jgi:DNA-binding response OmpR family regulator